MNSQYPSSSMLGNLSTSEKSPYANLLEALAYVSARESALLKQLIQFEQLCNYQSLLMNSDYFKQQLPSMSKFKGSEFEPKISKKVLTWPEEQHQVNILATEPKIEYNSEVKADSEFDQSESQVSSLNDEITIKEENVENAPKELDKKTRLIMQLNNVLIPSEENGGTYTNADSTDGETDSSTIEQRRLRKLKKLDACLCELVKKLGIKDTAVVAYGREYLQMIIPHLVEHFNKKPFVAIAAAVLIVASYKAEYPVTTAQIIKTCEIKDVTVMKCFYALKELILQKKNQ